MASSRAARISAALACACLSACGGDDGDDGSSLRGAVTGEWRNYCVATLTSDVEIDEGFDTLTLSAGSEYLVADYEDGFGDVRVQLLYLTPGGPYDVRLEVPTVEELPIRSNCDLPNAKQYYAVFQNLAVYGEKELTNKLCDLSAGSVVPRDTTMGISQGVADFGSIDLSSKPQTYQFSLNAFSAQCGGGKDGFISVPSIEVAGTTTWLPGIHWILGPG